MSGLEGQEGAGWTVNKAVVEVLGALYLFRSIIVMGIVTAEPCESQVGGSHPPAPDGL